MSAPSPTDFVRWALSIYTREPAILPLLDSDPALPNAIVFVPGLTDTFGTVPYLERLARGVATYGFSIVQLQLSSSLGGYGVCSLEGDAQEMALAVTWLREQEGKDKIILMGHSTGCQDTMAYLSFVTDPEARGKNAVVDAAILQAPVSDREAWEGHVYGKDGDSGNNTERSGVARSIDEHNKTQEIESLELATKLVKEGKGYQLLPRKVAPMPRPASGGASACQAGNVDAVNNCPMTAYRQWSLYAKGGDDDFFSTDLDATTINDIWQSAGKGLRAGGGGFILALIGAEDEYLFRPHTTPESIVETWSRAVQPDSRCRFETLSGANHKVNSEDAQVVLISKVRSVIEAIDIASKPTVSLVSLRGTPAPSRTGRMRPPHPPSTVKGIPAWQLADGADQVEGKPRAAAVDAPSGSKSSAAVPPSATKPTAAIATTVESASTLPTRTSAMPSHPPSFDAVVELIASGRTDEIEDIRHIPLQINQLAPSQSQMAAPRKPWERGDQPQS